MIKGQILDDLLSYRNRLDEQLLKGKISPINYSYRTYFYFRQQRLKFVKKAHDINSIIFNYIFWLSRVERRVMVERELYEIDPAISSMERLEEINFFFNRRRNQMVRRLLVEFEDEIEILSAKIVHQDSVELKLWIKEKELIFYANKEVFDRLKIPVENLSLGERKFYLPFLFFDLPLDINA